ncbi:hypothetical protein AAF712_010563 [Marasmius tenuissimus]|uniref:Amidohydrolase-related domain-containing protein n=1 Tax=Marasmius tenuissimus TaxID=585030 RepID=A0ABR2ZMV6_9AGAR|nr:hypothetical protein PM082_021105 [Marasmius tenuissimus]
MPTTPMLLLTNGTALLHGTNDKVVPTRTDILVEGNIIARVEPDIDVPPGTEVMVIDCTNKIISPGFVDGHQHVWQTLNRGRHADDSLLEYMPKGNLTSDIHTAEDIFWGELGGCLSLLNAGTTTVVDHSHINVAPGRAETAILAAVTSGIRSLYCFTPTTRVKSWKPLVLEDHNILEPWLLSDFSTLVEKAPFGPNGRVQLGLGFDFWHLPVDVAKPLFDIALKGGVKLVTGHMVGGGIWPFGEFPQSLEKFGLFPLGNGTEKPFRILLSHATEITKEQVDVFVENDVYIVSTPTTELQMGQGRPVGFDDDIREKACFGGDCQSNGGYSIIGELRLGLQAERGMRNQKFVDKGKGVRTLHRTVEQAFNLGTIQGARAVGMGDKIGSIGVGKFADLVVFDGESPGMVCAAQTEPVAAVMLFSTPEDITTVIVDGLLRKFKGKLRPVQVEVGAKALAGGDTLEWKDIVKRILEKREDYWDRNSTMDFKSAEDDLMKGWGISEEKITNDL